MTSTAAVPWDTVGELWLAEHDRLVAYLARAYRLGSADGADVAHQAFLELAEYGAKNPIEGSGRGLLYTIAKRRALDEQRRRSRLVQAGLLGFEVDVEGEERPFEASMASEPFADVEDARIADVVNETLRELPEAQAQAFILTVLRGTTLAEASSLLGAPVRTVHQRRETAAKAIRRNL